MDDVKVECRAMEGPVWSDPGAREMVRAPFGGNWSRTLQLLRREVSHLGGSHVVIELEISAARIRRDGFPYATEDVGPPVRVSFDSDHGPLSYRSDRYATWKDNVHAVALGLERLRAVDRYGISSRGEQYQGWAALPPGGGSSLDQSFEGALAVIAAVGGVSVDSVRRHPIESIRSALVKSHPDHGGSTETFFRVQEARETIEREMDRG